MTSGELVLSHYSMRHASFRDRVQAAVLAYECGLVRPGTAPPTG